MKSTAVVEDDNVQYRPYSSSRALSLCGEFSSAAVGLEIFEILFIFDQVLERIVSPWVHKRAINLSKQ
jgi:hypothetical protein